MSGPLSERCRLCGKPDFELTAVESNVSTRIKILFHLEIKIYSDEDKLSKSICSNCTSSVGSCWAFYLQVHRTQCELANAYKKESLSDEEDPLVHIKLESKSIDDIVKVEELTDFNCSEDFHTSDNDIQSTDTGVKPKKPFKFHGITKPRDDKPSDPDETWSEYPWWCLTCKQHFDDKRAYNKHECYRKYRRYFCFDCSKAFIIYNRFITHVKTFHWDRLKMHILCQCDVCKRWFDSKEEQEFHREQEHPDAEPRPEPKMPAYFSLTCVECDKTFSSRYNLKLHMLAHSDKLSYVCDVCGKALRYPESLKLHILKYHSESERLLYCDQCGKKSISKTELKQHMIMHATERPFTCDICHKTFKVKYQLKIHINRHSDKKAHVCETCGKRFNCTQNLRCHRNMHKKEKSHKCSFCDKAFKMKGNLISHERQHTGEQPYNCTVCDRKFTCYGNRLKHMRRIHKVCLNEKNINGD